MKLLFFCPHWGAEHLPLSAFFQQVKEAGYDGVEMNIPNQERFDKQLPSLLKEYNLMLIAQQYLPPAIETEEAYKKRMEQYLRRLASFSPLFINSHTGKDFFDFNTNCRMIETAEAISMETSIPIVHETHRGRFSYSSFAMRPYFEKYPNLKITADFSHWCCVSESYLDDQKKALQEAIVRSEHIHARVGHTEGPQVTHPGATEWAEALNHHLKWWDAIIDFNRKKGKKRLTITPEFGAIPYLPTLPFTNQPIASQWEINIYMKDLLKNRYKGQN